MAKVVSVLTGKGFGLNLDGLSKYNPIKDNPYMSWDTETLKVWDKPMSNYIAQNREG